MNPKMMQQLMQFAPLIFLFVVFYFLLIRPQKQQQKQRQEMLNALKVGDKVLTSGGIYGTITKVTENSLRVKIARDVEISVSRAGVASVTSKTDDEEE